MMHAATFRCGILLALVPLGASTATAQPELFFATGTDSTGRAQAQSNADGHVLIESPQYPHGLWLYLVDEAGDALAGLRVEYQGRPDSLVAIRCVDPVGIVRETLIWTRPDGDSLRLMLKPTGSDDLPAGLTAIDWQIDPTASALLEPVAETRLMGWEAVESFLQAHWQDRAGRVPVQLNASISFAVELDHPKAVETLVAHLQQTHQLSLGKSTFLNVQLFSGSSALQEGVIVYLSLFADANLERVVREALGRLQGRLTLEDVASLTSISAYNNSISSLAGLENCTALQTLDLSFNQITDITPLANLNNLKSLFLLYNQIADITPLTNLNNLQVLNLSYNQIADITPLTNLNNLNNLKSLSLLYNQIAEVGPLANLNNLQSLSLSYNQIADITSLANLNNLQSLFLSYNQIADITPLTNLNKLQLLWLRHNQIAEVGPLAGLYKLNQLSLENNHIEDISALVANTGLGEGDEVHLTDNPLSDQARNEQIPALQARGVDVTY